MQLLDLSDSFEDLGNVSGNIAVDGSKARTIYMTLTGNTTIENFDNGQPGAYTIFVKQDSTGGYTLAVGGNVVNAGGNPNHDALSASIYASYYEPGYGVLLMAERYILFVVP